MAARIAAPRSTCPCVPRRLPAACRAACSSLVPPPRYDFVVVGAGVIGVQVALVLKERRPHASVAVFDKEPSVGLHASGRNSGVLHAGFYYAADSLKARMTAAGGAHLARYCERRGLPLRRCGKLVVARSEADLPGLHTLLSRGRANGVDVHEVSADRARGLEPLARTHVAALWSPATAVGDPAAVLDALTADAVAAGVVLRLGAPVAALDARGAERGGGVTVLGAGGSGAPAPLATTGHVVNAAGLYADRLAHTAGHGAGLACVPFRGAYLYSTVPLSALVYPVPDLAQPFLGVHWTVDVRGAVKIGPTAAPAPWREAYGGPDGVLAGFAAGELCEQAVLQARLLASSPGMRALAAAQARKLRRGALIADAAALVPSATPDRFTARGRAGIRAQLVRTADMALIMDFVVQGDGATTHVLNAVSPGWTASRPVAEHVAARALGDGGGAAVVP